MNFVAFFLWDLQSRREIQILLFGWVLLIANSYSEKFYDEQDEDEWWRKERLVVVGEQPLNLWMRTLGNKNSTISICFTWHKSQISITRTDSCWRECCILAASHKWNRPSRCWDNSRRFGLDRTFWNKLGKTCDGRTVFRAIFGQVFEWV